MRNWIFIILMAGLPSLAQDVQEQMSVILREARIHVLDKDGKPIVGLSKDDFVLEENGKLMPLTYFEEVNYSETRKESDKDAPPAVQPRRTMVMVLDSSNMKSGDFSELITATEEFIEKELGANDFVKLVQLDDKATSLTRFTNDKQKLLAGLKRASYKGTLKKALTRAEAGISRDLPDFMRLNELVDFWRRREETTDGRDKNHALEEKLKYENLRKWSSRAIDTYVEEKERYKATNYRNHYLHMQFIARMLAPMDGTRSIYLLSGGLYLENDPNISNTGAMATQLGQLLNTHKITVYSIQKDTHIMTGESSLQMAGYPIDVDRLRKIGSMDQEFSQRPEKIRNTDNTVLENDHQSETGIRVAAEHTGGVFKRAYKDNLYQMMQELREASSNFYVLGYQGEETRTKSRLKISLVNKPQGAVLRYGKEFAQKTPYSKLAPDEQEATFKADILYSQSRRDDLLSSWDYYLFRDPQGGYRIPVTGTFPLAEHFGAHDIGFTALDQDREPLDFTYTSLKNMPKQDRVSFYDVLLSDKRPHYIRFSVRNQANDEVSIEEMAIGPPIASEEGTYLSDMVPIYEARNTLPLNELRQRESKKDKNEAEDPRLARDPFRFGDKSVRPNGRTRYNSPKAVDFVFHLQNFKDPVPDLKLQFMLKTDKEILPGEGTTLLNMERIDEETLLYHCRLDTSKLLPNNYEVWVKMLDTKTKTEYMSYHQMEIVAPGNKQVNN